MKILLFVSAMVLSVTAMSASYIRVVNQSAFPVVAIWQASSCVDVWEDPEDDNQYFSCRYEKLNPGYSGEHVFRTLDFDRSVKVWGANGGERIGYCNSMDDSILTVTGDTAENQEVTDTASCYTLTE